MACVSNVKNLLPVNFRQNMYNVMDEEGILPKADKEPLNVGFTCMVGVTRPMDPKKYPELSDDFAHFRSVVGGVRHSVRCKKKKGGGGGREFVIATIAQRRRSPNSYLT